MPNATGAWKWTSPPGPTLGVTSPRDVTRGPDGRLWVTAYKQHQIKVYNVTGAGVWTTAPVIVLGDGVTAGHGDGQLNFPYNVTFSPAGTTVYVSDTGNARIARWSLNGTQVTRLSPFGGRCSFPERRSSRAAGRKGSSIWSTPTTSAIFTRAATVRSCRASWRSRTICTAGPSTGMDPRGRSSTSGPPAERSSLADLEHPVTAYLNWLAPSSRRPQLAALEAIARRSTQVFTAESMPWQRLRQPLVLKIRSLL